MQMRKEDSKSGKEKIGFMVVVGKPEGGRRISERKEKQVEIEKDSF